MKRIFITQDIVGLGGGPRWRDVSPEQLEKLPWSSIAQIVVSENDDVVSVGTGWLASSNTVVTAAHVVDLPRRPANARSVAVRFSSIDRVFQVEDIEVHDSYVFKGSSHYDQFDIAMLCVDDTGLPKLKIESEKLEPAEVEIAGFPKFGSWTGRFVTHNGSLVYPPGDENILLYSVDTKGGQSGAPVVVNSGTADAAVIGIHVQPTGGNPFSSTYPRHNVGLAFTRELSLFVTEITRQWE